MSDVYEELAQSVTTYLCTALESVFALYMSERGMCCLLPDGGSVSAIVVGKNLYTCLIFYSMIKSATTNACGGLDGTGSSASCATCSGASDELLAVCAVAAIAGCVATGVPSPRPSI